MQSFTPQDPNPLDTRPQARRRRSDRYAARGTSPEDGADGRLWQERPQPRMAPRVTRAPRVERHDPPEELPPEEAAPPRTRRQRTNEKKAQRALDPARVLTLVFLSVVCVLCAYRFALKSLQIAELKEQRLRAEQEYQAMVERHRPRYASFIETYAQKYAVNPAYIAAVIYRESHYDPRAESGAGARGLMQLMPDTGTWMAEKAGLEGYTTDSLYDPETNIRLGTRYLNYLSGLFDGDPILVACGYHAGANNVRSWLEKYSSDGVHLTLDEIPKDDSQTYARRVMESYAIYLQHYYPEDPSAADSARAGSPPGAV